MPQGPIPFTIAKNPAGAQVQGSAGQLGELVVGQAVGDYFEAVDSATVWGAANQAGATTSAGLATTYLGFCLSNPAGSGKKLSVLRISAALLVAPAAVLAIGLIQGYSAAGIVTHTTALTPSIKKIGNTTAVGVGLADAACTLVGTPVWDTWLADNSASAGLFSSNVGANGLWEILPGGYLAIGTNVAGPAAGFVGSMAWQELPLVNGA